SVYWTGAPYLGLGNGAHSFAPPVRRWNVRDWDEYRARAAGPSGAEESREHVDAEATDLEAAWLGLRTRRGVPEPEPGSRRALLVRSWVKGGLAIAERGRVRLTPAGWLLLDRLAVDFTG
ncbi:MAG: hypothetical protein LC667_14955, partial [Thioalkalivibrio sp.]|nr:hypothetical protein [Thioalkalivibrio sp.]